MSKIHILHIIFSFSISLSLALANRHSAFEMREQKIEIFGSLLYCAFKSNDSCTWFSLYNSFIDSFPSLTIAHFSTLKKNEKKSSNESTLCQYKIESFVNFLLFHFVTTSMQLHTDTVIANGHGHRQRDEPPCVSLTIHNSQYSSFVCFCVAYARTII